MTREEEIKLNARWRADQYDHPTKWSDTYYGFINGAEWADEHPHWISVNDELPKEHFKDSSSKWVLVCTPLGSVYIDSYNHKNKEWVNNRKSVTHWMPLPAPPHKEIIMKLIDKDALVAEIKKRLLPVVRDKHYDEWEMGQDSERLAILNIINTLEVKEVVLEKEKEVFIIKLKPQEK